MKTTEEINGKTTSIDWTFETIEDDHDQWASWSMTGKDSDGNEYSGTAEASKRHPYDDNTGTVHDVELVSVDSRAIMVITNRIIELKSA